MAFIVFAGQSNMGGLFMTPATLPQAWTPDPLTLVWDPGQKAWTPMQPGANTGYGDQLQAWGPEAPFAQAFRTMFPDEVLRIVKTAHGGTGLDRDPAQWHYDWSPASEDELFDRATALIREAGAAAGGLRPDAVFWGQGEEDGTKWPSAQAYLDNLPAFFASVRDEWMGDPAGRIGFFQVDTSTPFADEVRRAQQLTDAWDGRAESFDTQSYPMQDDSLHYSAEGYRMLGGEFLRLYAGWRGADPGPGGEVGRSLDGTPWADTLTGGGGDDSIGGGAGLDMLRGGDGRDRMSGGDEFDDMHGNGGDDTLAGGRGDDWVVGGRDHDRLFGDEGSDIVYGNLGDDLCDGGAGNDLVRGGQGSDQLFGWSGDDWLSGDRGDDTVSGGSGADIFHSFGEAGVDRITDFNAPEGDRIQLDPGTTWRIDQVGADAVISLDGGAQVVLVGVSAASFVGAWVLGA